MHKITTEWMWAGWVDYFLSLTHNQLHYYFSLNWIEMGNNNFKYPNSNINYFHNHYLHTWCNLVLFTKVETGLTF